MKYLALRTNIQWLVFVTRVLLYDLRFNGFFSEELYILYFETLNSFLCGLAPGSLLKAVVEPLIVQFRLFVGLFSHGQSYCISHFYISLLLKQPAL